MNAGAMDDGEAITAIGAGLSAVMDSPKMPEVAALLTRVIAHYEDSRHDHNVIERAAITRDARVLLARLERQGDDPFTCPDCGAHMVKIGIGLYRCTRCGEKFEGEETQ